MRLMGNLAFSCSLGWKCAERLNLEGGGCRRAVRMELA